MHKFARRAIAAVALALGAGASLPALAQAVVIRSTGPSAASYPAGKRLPAGTKVTLRTGDIVTVLDRVGTRVLRGAGTFDLDATINRDASAAARLARSLDNPIAVRAGAVRGAVPMAQGPVLPPTVWVADVDKGGRVCVPRGSDLYLWRDNSSARRFTWLGEAAGGALTRVLWPSQTAGVPWPKAIVPLDDGRNYTSVDDGADGKSVNFELVLLDPDTVPTTAANLGAMLLDNGCKAQFDWLTQTLTDQAPQG